MLKLNKRFTCIASTLFVRSIVRSPYERRKVASTSTPLAAGHNLPRIVHVLLVLKMQDYELKEAGLALRPTRPAFYGPKYRPAGHAYNTQPPLRTRLHVVYHRSKLNRRPVCLYTYAHSTVTVGCVQH